MDAPIAVIDLPESVQSLLEARWTPGPDSFEDTFDRATENLAEWFSAPSKDKTIPDTQPFSRKQIADLVSDRAFGRQQIRTVGGNFRVSAIAILAFEEFLVAAGWGARKSTAARAWRKYQERLERITAKLGPLRLSEQECESAWNKDPVFGVIGIQSEPRG
jgi:hypothetical protein